MTRTTDLAAAKAALSGLCGGSEPMSVLAAVSGGLDSMCLLHLLTTWGRERGLLVTAAHFDHRLRGAESDRDAAFVRERCGEYGVPFAFGGGDVRGLAVKKGLSLEEAAREARYAFLTEQRERLGCAWILTAHHADDNAETLLLNLLRGTGLRGLCGIPPCRDGIFRPFLQVTREELAAYAAENHILHVEDSTNALDDAARNILRHRVMPVLKELNPRAVENMTRTAALLRRDEEALERETDALLSEADVRPGMSASLSVHTLRAAPMAVQSRVVLALMSAVGGHKKDLTAAHVQAVLALRQGELSLPCGVTVRREADTLRFAKTADVPQTRSISVGETVRFGGWQVTLDDGPGAEGIYLSFPRGAALTATVWNAKDRLNGRTLKRLWAERGIPPTERDRLPVLRVDGQAAAAAELPDRDEAFAPNLHEQAARVIFYNTEENEQ